MATVPVLGAVALVGTGLAFLFTESREAATGPLIAGIVWAVAALLPDSP